MKSFYNSLNVILTVFFVLGILFSAYNLLNLPIAIEKISGKIDLTVIKELSPVLNQTYFIVGLTLATGLSSIILALYLLNYTKTAEKIIYVEKSDTHKQDIAQKEESAKKEDLTKQIKIIQSDAIGISDRKLKYEKVLSNLCMTLEASQGIVYCVQNIKGKKFVELYATFAYNLPESKSIKFEFGEGLVGQVAKEGKKINITDIPKGYITIISGLGASSPNHLVILPVRVNDEIAFVAEIASFNEITAAHETLIVESLTLDDNMLKTTKEKQSSKKVANTKEENNR